MDRDCLSEAGPADRVTMEGDNGQTQRSVLMEQPPCDVMSVHGEEVAVLPSPVCVGSSG